MKGRGRDGVRFGEGFCKEVGLRCRFVCWCECIRGEGGVDDGGERR